MSAVRLVLGLLLVFSGTAVGLHLSARLSRRREVLTEISALLSAASIRIGYRAGDLCEVFSENFAGFSFRYDAPFDEQWRAFIDSFDCLTAGDRELLCGFADELGASDSKSQQRHIAMYAKLVEEHLDSARAELESKAKLCRVLPVSAGFVLAILIL